ncbi:MAG: NTP transferase domain-containing protein, partial [Candidatus Pacearchaeota archaeon]|nr:NTP transferase domain-containing protein [Candidatus Pacearchaeota archaeon]
METALILMAAGASSRFGGKAKQFAPVGPNDETLIEYSVNQAIKSGFDKMILVTSDKTRKGLKDIFGSS